MEWQPISTAPKDRRILLACRGRVLIGSWSDDQYRHNPRPYWTNDLEAILGKFATRSDQPTHWMPLPELPTTTDQAASRGAAAGVARGAAVQPRASWKQDVRADFGRREEVTMAKRNSGLEEMIKTFLAETSAGIADCVLVEQMEGNALTWRIEKRPANPVDNAVTDEQVTEFSLACLTNEARLAIMRQWCPECGGAAPCNCSRDE